MNKRYISVILLVVAIGAILVVGLLNNKREKIATSANRVSLISQENNVFKIKLLPKWNSDKMNSSWQYKVGIYNVNPEGKVIDRSPLDTAYYDDIIDVIGDQRNIVYEAPKYLVGKYLIRITYYADAGMSQDVVELGVFNLNGDGGIPFLEINQNSCYLQVAGESLDKKYSLNQGIDVKKEEGLVAKCLVRNISNQKIIAFSRFINFGHGYNSIEKEQEVNNIEQIIFNPGEEKALSLIIPKALKAGVYDAELFFADQLGTKISTKTKFHYVMYGESAGIYRATPNKSRYDAGEKAEIAFSYLMAADAFENSRLGGTKNMKLVAKVDVLDKNGMSCSGGEKDFALSYDKDKYVPKLNLDIKRECQNPSVKAKILGSKGDVLDERVFSYAYTKN